MRVYARYPTPKFGDPTSGKGPRAPTVSMTLQGYRAEQVATQLATRGLQVWHGHFYAPRVLEAYDLVSRGGLLRTGFALYNTAEEVARLLEVLTVLASRPHA